MISKLKIVAVLCLIFCLQNLFAQNKNPTSGIFISSPDGAIKFHLESKSGTLTYSIDFNKIPIIESSALGLMVKGNSFGDGTTIEKVERYNINETYPFRGVHCIATNKCNGAKMNINAKQNFIVEVRVFNDGVAFRYIIDNKDSSTIGKDNSEFVIPAGCITWSQNNIKYYEGKYGRKSIEEYKEGDLVGPPITIQFAGNTRYAAITEGGLTDFGGMSLKYKSNRTFIANLTGITKKSGIIETPWRIIEIGKDLNTLVNCDIIANVSPPYDPKLFSKGYNSDWVKPGKSVWSWLAEKRDITLPNMKHFTDLAAELGFEYNLVDEGWSNWKDSINHKDAWDMMKELVDYSAKKGIKIWVWKAYPDRKGIPGIKDVESRKKFFQKCKDLGIAGMKVDFFDSEAQEIVDFYQTALHDGAEYHLMMDFHGANKPAGQSRTYPNEMSREAVRGLENQPPWAEANTILPFTRYLAGHGDFTPMHFGKRLGEVTWAHHLATMVVFTSPFMCVGADPQSILDNPCKQMIQSIPSTWDETIVLPNNKIGELVLFARRKGTTWFLAAMNGTTIPTTLYVPLSFLKNGAYKFSSVKDDKEKQANAIVENSKVSSSTILTIELNATGGYVGRISLLKISSKSHIKRKD